MAVYEYLCPKCREVFEVTRPMSQSNDVANCPKCSAKGEKLPSVFSSTAEFNVKGPDKDAFRGNINEGPSKSKQVKAKTLKVSATKKRGRQAR